MHQFFNKLKVIILSSRSRQQVWGAGLGVFLVLTVGGFLLFNKNDGAGRTETSGKAPAFKNYLQPTAEIKVGENRYYSPCQVLPLADIENIYGSLGDDDSILEKYLDASANPVDKSIETSCMYGRKLVLHAEQYTDIGDARQIDRSVYILGDDKADEKITAFEKAANSTSDQSLKDFVSKMKTAVSKYENYSENRSSGRSVATANVDGLVFPVGNSAYGFNVLYGNVMYRLEYTTDNRQTLDKQLAGSESEIADNLRKIQQSMQVLAQHAQDKKLDQSPAATILGSTDKPKATKILEPCAVLSPKAFNTITGLNQNDVVSRLSVYKNVEKQRRDNSGKTQLFPNNSCTRKNSQDRANSFDSNDISVQLELEYGDSTETVDKKLAEGFTFGANDTVLQTSADWAVEFIDQKPSGQPEPPYYIFRIGGYIGVISITKVISSGDSLNQPQGSREDHAKAINVVVEALKTSIQE